MSRVGILCAGNWVVDHIQFLDEWPAQGHLVEIISQSQSVGGGSANITFNLHNLQVNFPIIPLGCLGDDDQAKWLLTHCHKANINTDYMQISKETSTSYTQVMQVKSSGQRTFFHFRGANDCFELTAAQLDKLTSFKMLHISYLLLLKKLDQWIDTEHTAASQLLKIAKQLGFVTSVDLVSQDSAPAAATVISALPYIDYLIINDIEAGNIARTKVRNTIGQLVLATLKDAARTILQLGAKTLIIHMPEGALWADADKVEWYPHVLIPKESIISSVGAGDAFCTGVLYGLHEQWPQERLLQLGHHLACHCLMGEGASDNIFPALLDGLPNESLS